MSVVCVKVYDDRIEIASDSISVKEGTQNKGADRKYSKLFQIRDLIIGSIGHCAESALMRSFCSTTQPESASEERITEFIKSFVEWKKKITDKFELLDDYFIIFQGKVFFVENSFFITEVITFDAIGAGRDYALAALYLGHDVEKAVEVATELSIYCEKPIKKLVVKK